MNAQVTKRRKTRSQDTLDQPADEDLCETLASDCQNEDAAQQKQVESRYCRVFCHAEVVCSIIVAAAFMTAQAVRHARRSTVWIKAMKVQEFVLCKDFHIKVQTQHSDGSWLISVGEAT